MREVLSPLVFGIPRSSQKTSSFGACCLRFVLASGIVLLLHLAPIGLPPLLPLLLIIAIVFAGNQFKGIGNVITDFGIFVLEKIDEAGNGCRAELVFKGINRFKAAVIITALNFTEEILLFNVSENQAEWGGKQAQLEPFISLKGLYRNTTLMLLIF
jgi:hypothetical protein